MQISCSEKVYNRREKFSVTVKLIHAVKVFHAVKNAQVLAVKKCHTVKKVTVSAENPLMQSIVNILLVFPMKISKI